MWHDGALVKALVKVKVPPQAEAHRAALISVSVALSHAPDKSARPQTRG